MRAGAPVVICAAPMLAACAGMTMREINAVRPNCAKIDRQIAILKKEKAENNQRVLAGIQSVAPALAAINIVAGTYGRNVAIATGDWGRAIDRKIVELKRTKQRC